MTLRQDCELWATFDSEDVDPNRGIVRDRSGKGRTLQASGGPTYGQSSPVGEAVGFDGSDDLFDVGDPLAAQEQTIFFILQDVALDGTEGKFYGANDGTNGIFFEVSSNDKLRADIRDGSGGKVVLNSSVLSDTSFRATFVYDGSEARLFKDTTVVDSAQISSHNETQQDVKIGSNAGANNNFFEGKIAFAAKWNRAFSDAEIDELTRMTDRMVTKL